MSEQLSFDRTKGFVALPVEIMDFDLTPGAFRTLAELCRMANTDGLCWPSLHQLSDRLGRSRSAISGYIRELRAAGLVRTEEQKTANGYNYRLKYCVTFWQEWRASLKGRTVPKTERSVQQDARSKDSKNQKHLNHTPEVRKTPLDTLLSEWAGIFAGAPYPMVRKSPPSALVSLTAHCLAIEPPQAAVPEAEIARALQTFWSDLRVATSPEHLREQTALLHAQSFTPAELQDLLAAVARDWPAHWRKSPEEAGWRKLVKVTGVVSQHSKRAVLARHYKRWKLAEKTLQKA